MNDKKIHTWALSLIALAFVAKIISLILTSGLHPNLKIFEFFSIAIYFAYAGWLGFMKRQSKEDNGNYMMLATFLVVLDVVTYYLMNGWN